MSLVSELVEMKFYCCCSPPRKSCSPPRKNPFSHTEKSTIANSLEKIYPMPCNSTTPQKGTSTGTWTGRSSLHQKQLRTESRPRKQRTCPNETPAKPLPSRWFRLQCRGCGSSKCSRLRSYWRRHEGQGPWRSIWNKIKSSVTVKCIEFTRHDSEVCHLTRSAYFRGGAKWS